MVTIYQRNTKEVDFWQALAFRIKRTEINLITVLYGFKHRNMYSTLVTFHNALIYMYKCIFNGQRRVKTIQNNN